MKALSTVLTAALISCGAAAQAQFVYWPGADLGGGIRYHHHASTAAEGWLRGWGDWARAVGQYNYLMAEARRAHAQARQQEIVNHQDEVQAYFSLRDLNRQQRAAARRPRVTPEQLRRIADTAKPKPVSPSDVDWITGAISWPEVLSRSEYDRFRTPLQQAFAERAAGGEPAPATKALAGEAADQMLEELRTHIREASPQEYMAARRFIESLAHELEQPAG